MRSPRAGAGDKDADIQVGVNRPRLLEPGAPPPSLSSDVEPDQLQQPAAPYWSADKAARVLAEGGKALSKLYGPDFKLAAVEVDLVGQPMANVLNDWVALPSGPQGDKLANLLGLVAVVGLLVAFRLPDILDAHDMLPGWSWVRRQRERGRRPPRAAEAEDQVADVGELPRPRRTEPTAELEVGPAPDPTRRDWSKYGPTVVGSGYRAEAG